MMSLFFRKRRTACLVWAVAACCMAAGAADVLVLENGESLSGTFGRIREGVLVFRTSMQGQMMTPVRAASALTTRANLYIALEDGSVLYGAFGVREGTQVVIPLDGGNPVTVDIADVRETLPIPSPPAGSSAPPADWQVDAGAGVQWREGDASRVGPATRLEMRGPVGPLTFEGGVAVEPSDPEDFPAWLRAHATLTAGSGEVRPYASVDLERDMDRAVDLRSRLALGLYRDFAVTDTHFLGGLAGVAVEHEEGDRDSARIRRSHFGRDAQDQALFAQLGLRYFGLFARRHTISEAITLLPSFSDPGEFRAYSEMVYTLPLSHRLHLRLSLAIEYDSDPLSDGMSRWSTTVGAGLNMNF